MQSAKLIKNIIILDLNSSSQKKSNAPALLRQPLKQKKKILQLKNL